jgi:RND family efflux transporter MFP subunit
MKAKFLPRFALAAGVTVLLVWSLSADAQQGPPPAPVKVALAEVRSMASSVLAPGTVVSRQDAAVAAEVAGRLTWVADVGLEVDAGDVIARIDDHRLSLQLRDNEATIRRLEASLAYSDKQLARQKQLASQNIAARNALDEIEAERDMTAQDLVQARVAREQTLYLIENSSIRAPFGGRIVERFRDAGEYISVCGEVARVVDTRNVEVRAQAPLSVAAHIREGLEVSVREGAREVRSPIRAVIPVGDEVSRMIEIRIALDGSDWVIGSAVRVALPEEEPVEVVAVPRDALVLRQNAIYVFRLKDDDTVDQVPVTTGIGNGSYIEVRGDIRGGDPVVVRGAERLRSGQQVMVARDEAASAEELQIAKKG